MKQLAAEGLGTFLLVAIGCGAAAWDALHGGLGTMGVALVFGLVVAALVQTAGPVSGAHLNPAVTLAFWARRRIQTKRACAYLLVQGIGAVLGAVTVLLLFHDMAATVTRPVAGFGLVSAFSLEVAITFVLVFVILLVATAPRLQQWFRAVMIGAAVWFGAYFAGPLTGGSMNPARSLGPAVVAGDLTLLWLYFVAPAIGALIALGTHYAVVRLVNARQTPHPPIEGL